MALLGNKMPLSGVGILFLFLTKKVAEMFGYMENISYLCNIENKAGTGPPDVVGLTSF